MDFDAGQGEQVAAPQTSTAQFAEDAPADSAAVAPLPAASALERAIAIEISDETPDDADERPTVETQAWLKKDDYWQRTTYIAVTGRHTAAAPQTRPLPRPRRFRRPSPLRSLLILALTVALIVLIPIGVVIAQREATTHIKLPNSIPGLSQPTATHTATHTPTPTATIKPTATPKKKK